VTVPGTYIHATLHGFDDIAINAINACAVIQACSMRRKHSKHTCCRARSSMVAPDSKAAPMTSKRLNRIELSTAKCMLTSRLHARHCVLHPTRRLKFSRVTGQRAYRYTKRQLIFIKRTELATRSQNVSSQFNTHPCIYSTRRRRILESNHDDR
jgi:hypothetical protein